MGRKGLANGVGRLKRVSVCAGGKSINRDKGMKNICIIAQVINKKVSFACLTNRFNSKEL